MNRLKGFSIYTNLNTTIARLHNTDIVTIDHENKRLILKTDQWRTKHIKKCMNLILNQFDLMVKQKDFQWRIEGIGPNRDMPVIPFYEGLQVDLLSLQRVED